MTVIHISAPTNATHTISDSGNTYIFDPDDWIATASGPALEILASGNSNTLRVGGSLTSQDTVTTLRVEAEDTKIIIEETGQVTGEFGVGAIDVEADIVNRGLILAEDVGLYLQEAGGRIVNYGTISSSYDGTAIFQTVAAGSLTIANHGLISGNTGMLLEAPDLTIRLSATSVIHAAIGIIAVSAPGQASSTVNNGLIACPSSAAFAGDAGEDMFINRGTIYGNVALGNGDDKFVNSGQFKGSVNGGGGDDLFILKSVLNLVEGSTGGDDTVRIGKSYTLADNVETLIALGRGDITLAGNNDGNTIKGNAGDNRIAGGTASDTLTGGGGDDLFIYNKFDGADVITDFHHGQDRIRIGGFTQYTNFGDLDIIKSGDDVRISFADENGADFITVQNQKVGDFDKGDFLFG